LDKLLQIFEIATSVATGIPGIGEGAALALKLEQIAALAIQAHEQVSGQPFDSGKIPAIDPVP
jgi:hypothetical protein